MLPTFICIGPGRAGTSWLYEVLLEHPEVEMARNIKETYFFDRNYEKGVEWYKTFFADAGAAKARGEITNRYIFDSRVAERIHAYLPDCKLIVCVRNPIDRIISNYFFKIRDGTLDCGFEEALEKMPQLVDESRYFHYLTPFLEKFPLEQFFFMDFDLLKSDPQKLCRELFAFLGVDVAFIPTVINRQVNKTILPRFFFAPYLTKGAAKLFRRLGMYSLLTFLKRSDRFKGMFFRDPKDVENVKISLATRKLLREWLRDDIAALETVTGRRFDWQQKVRNC